MSASIPASMDLHPRPPSGVARPWKFPVPMRTELPNGLRVLHCHLPGQQLVTVHLFVAVPLHLEPPGADGLATVMARALVEGLEHLDAQDFAAELERHGANLEAYADHPGIRVVLTTPARYLATMLGLVADALREPAFSDEGVNRVIRLRLDEIQHELASPARCAGMGLYRHLFSQQDRLSLPRQGTQKGVQGIHPAMVAAFHRRHVGPSAITAIVVGDVRDGDLAAALTKSFGDWRSHEIPSQHFSSVTSSTKPRIVIVDRPRASQTYLMAGSIAAGRSHPTWAAQEAGIYSLGGTLTSRLNLVLREQKGITYGMRAVAQPLVSPVNGRDASLAAINGAVATGATAEALTDIRHILDTIARHGLTSAERDFAVKVAVETAPLAMQTSVAVATVLIQQVEQNLPDDAQAQHYGELSRVTAADTSAAVTAAFPPNRLTTVLVGDADRIADPVRSLGLATVEVEPMRGALLDHPRGATRLRPGERRRPGPVRSRVLSGSIT